MEVINEVDPLNIEQVLLLKRDLHDKNIPIDFAQSLAIFMSKSN